MVVVRLALVLSLFTPLTLAARSTRPVPATLAWIQSAGGPKQNWEFRVKTASGMGSISSTGLTLSPGVHLSFAGAQRVQGELGGRRFPLTRIATDGTATERRVASQEALFRNIYPGIDLRFHLSGGTLEFDLILAPGAHVERVRLQASQPFSIAVDGSVQFIAPTGISTQSAPVAWDQDEQGVLDPIHARFERCGADLCLAVPERRAGRRLTVNPTIRYAGYLGTSQSDRLAVAGSDSNGSLYVVGSSSGLFAEFPPLTPQPPELTPRAGDAPVGSFVAKFAPDDSIQYVIAFDFIPNIGTTIHSGTFGNAATVDTTGALYLVSQLPFPGAVVLDPATSPWNATPTRVLLTKVNPNGDGLVYRTFLPNTPGALTSDANGNLFLAGQFGLTSMDGGAFPVTTATQIVKLSPDGRQLLGATNLETSLDGVTSMAIDAEGGLIVAGTSSSTLPRTDDAMQRLNNGVPSYRSTDQGQSWSASDTDGVFQQDRADPDTLWQIVGGELLVSQNFGQSWSTRTSFAGTFTLKSFTTVRNQPGWMYAWGSPANSPQNMLMRSSDSGFTWTKAQSDLPRSLPEPDSSNPLHLLLAESGAEVQYSLDGGDTWRGTNFGGLNVPSVLFSDSVPGQAFINALNGAVYWFDFGQQKIVRTDRKGFPDAMIDPANPGNLILLLPSADNMAFDIYLSPNGYDLVKSGTTPPDSVLDHPIRTGQLVADGHTEGTLYWIDPYLGIMQRSTDFGATWQPFSPGVLPAGRLVMYTQPRTGEILAVKGLQGDLILSQFSPDLAVRNWSTYAGGDGSDTAWCVVVDADGSILLIGNTASTNFAELYGSADRRTGMNNHFVLRVSADGSTNLGFRQFGSSGLDSLESGFVDSAGNVVVFGYTSAADYAVTGDGALAAPPTSSGQHYVFTVLGPDLATLYATYLGGNGVDSFAAAPGPDGAIWLVGSTTSTDLPLTQGAAGPMGLEDLYLLLFDWRP